MDAHNPYHIRIFIQKPRLTIIHIIFFQLLYIPYKVKQPKITGFFKIRGAGEKHFHIGPALAAPGKRRHIIQIVKVIHQLCEQLPNGQINRTGPIRPQHIQEIRCLLRNRHAKGFRILSALLTGLLRILLQGLV